MPRYTDRWGLSILGAGDSLQSDGFKFCDADRELIDRLLTYATEQHRHTGAHGDDFSPDSPLNLILQSNVGTMASGTRYYYRYTLIDELGNESAPSPVGYVDTPSSIEAPGAPATNFVTGTGSLEPGGYSYVLSAYAGASTQETKATNSVFIAVPGTSPDNEVTLILPTLPIGADGFNVYRKSPSGMHYLWLASVAAPTPLQVWTDDGTLDGDCDRSLPSTNRTGATSGVLVVLPGATPGLAEGWSWKVYRATDPNNWGRSALLTITPTGDPPLALPSFLDSGLATDTGAPPAKVQVINAPPKINLTDGTEVDGDLPPGLAVQPQMLTFASPGPVVARPGTYIWVCDYDEADIVAVRLYLSIGSVPAVRPVQIDVLGLRPSKSSTDWTSLFAPDLPLPSLDVDETTSPLFTPARQHFEKNDAVSIDIVQSGGGATPTDTDLTVNLLLYVKDGSETQSYVWATT